MSKTVKMLMIGLVLTALLMTTMPAQASELWLPGEEHEVDGYRVEVTDFNELAIICYLRKR